MNTTPFRVTVNVPTGFIKITNRGVTFTETVPGDWFLPLAQARAVFDAALRSVEVMIEVEFSNTFPNTFPTTFPTTFPSSPAASGGVGAGGGRTSDTRGRVSADDGEIPPAERLPPGFRFPECVECPYFFPVCCNDA